MKTFGQRRPVLEQAGGAGGGPTDIATWGDRSGPTNVGAASRRGSAVKKEVKEEEDELPQLPPTKHCSQMRLPRVRIADRWLAGATGFLCSDKQQPLGFAVDPSAVESARHVQLGQVSLVQGKQRCAVDLFLHSKAIVSLGRVD